MCIQSLAATGPPLIINYQGTLTDAQGNPVTGQKTMSFRIYATPSATPAQALWNSQGVLVTVSKGVFSVNLGEPPQTPIPKNLFSDSDSRYLGVTVDGTELTDRKRLVSVPYALNAGSSIPKGVIVMWSGEVANIPQGWALCNGQNGTPDLRDRFVVGAGSAYSVGATGGTATNSLSHSHGISAEAGHAHHIGPYDLGNWVGPDIQDSVEDGSGDTPAGSEHMHRIDMDTGSGGSHSHGGATTAFSKSVDNQPPYFALCFIMKL